MTSILVTGGSGFIGRHVLPECVRAGYEVHAVTREDAPPALDGVLWQRLDLLDQAATEVLIERLRPEVLLHLAWYAEHGRLWTSPENLRWVRSSLGLVEAFARAGGRRIVTAGTCAEYDWGASESTPHCWPAADPLPEGLPRCLELETPLRPGTLYGASKLAANIVIERYASNIGIEHACGRMFFLYGPGEQPARLVPAVALALLRGEPVRTSDGSQIRDFMHVTDVGRGFAALADSRLVGPINIASGDATRVGTVIDLLAAEIGRPELIRRGALVPAAGEPRILLADVTRLRRELGFVSRNDLRDGLRETVEWWRRRI